jgi:class 3 adenylate cyclase
MLGSNRLLDQVVLALQPSFPTAFSEVDAACCCVPTGAVADAIQVGLTEGLLKRVGDEDRFVLTAEGEGRGYALQEEMRVAWNSAASRTLRLPLSPEEQAVLDLVADLLVEDHIRLPRGLQIRGRMPSGQREAKTALLRQLVPHHLSVHGSDQEDSYAMTPLGALKCKHADSLLALAEKLHTLARHHFSASDRVLPWEAVRAAIAHEKLSPIGDHRETVEFVMLCLGVWGGSAEGWPSPRAPQLEELLDETCDTRGLFARSHDELHRQRGGTDTPEAIGVQPGSGIAGAGAPWHDQQLATIRAAHERIEMATKTMTFQDAVRLVTSNPGDVRYDAHVAGVTATGYMDCGAPRWDPDGTYRLGLENGRLVVQHWWQDQWTAAPISPPASSAPVAESGSLVRTETRSILFMDLAGWSKLTPPQVLAYLEKALPNLAQVVSRFGAQHVNTWGDALVATFSSVTEAANCALDVRDFFRRASEAEGVPEGLVPRVALHVGEVVIAKNPLIDKTDIFGDAVHLAARLEPVAERGEVCCTSEFAASLQGVRGLGPKAHFIGEVTLPKGFGVTKLFAVTGPNEQPPTPSGGRIPEGDGNVTKLASS